MRLELLKSVIILLTSTKFLEVEKQITQVSKAKTLAYKWLLQEHNLT